MSDLRAGAEAAAEGAALQLPEATITKPFRSLRDLAHRNGYPDPTDPELIGPLAEHSGGVAWHRQGATHNVFGYNTERLHMTEGMEGAGVYDQLAKRNAGSWKVPSLASFGLRAGDVRDMEGRHARLEDLLGRAFRAGGYQYHEQFRRQQRGHGLPPAPEVMQTIEADVERMEARQGPGAEKPAEQTPPAWWWRSVESGKGYRMKQGTVSREAAEREGGWHGPYPTWRQARRDARASTRTAVDQRIGLFAV